MGSRAPAASLPLTGRGSADVMAAGILSDAGEIVSDAVEDEERRRLLPEVFQGNEGEARSRKSRLGNMPAQRRRVSCPFLVLEDRWEWEDCVLMLLPLERLEPRQLGRLRRGFMAKVYIYVQRAVVESRQAAKVSTKENGV